MEEFKLSDNVDGNKVFIVWRSELEERFEPKFYTSKYIENLKKIKLSKYPLFHLSQVTHLISDGTHFTPNYINKGIKF
ncbi:MAG: hypothetical protein WDA08_01600 [Weeksellaceae bacterium]